MATKKASDWDGGKRPMAASYGKLMMWFFLISDALTFSGFLAAYGLSRFKFPETWPIADEVFTHFPFVSGEYPLFFVALMTFILIMSSVTMVLAVNAGHKMNKKGVVFWMFLTVIGGITFLGSQAWEWSHFIYGEHGALQLKTGEVVHFVDKKGHYVPVAEIAGKEKHDGHQPHVSKEEVFSGLKKHPEVLIRRADRTILTQKEAEKIFKESKVIQGAPLVGGNAFRYNEYGPTQFSNFFYFITGFHGFHVFSGVVINIIIFIQAARGVYQRRGHYEMVEKVGLYWHFVDLVWVFVFTFFYLI